MVDLPPEVLAYFKQQGQRGGTKAAKQLTTKQRSQRAKKAAAKSAEVRSKNAVAKNKAKGPISKKKA